MRTLLLTLTLVALLLPVPGSAAPAFGDSPGARAVAAWFEALRRGGEHDLREVIAKHFTDHFPPAERIEAWREVGVLVPLEVVSETPKRIEVRVRDRDGGVATATFNLEGDRIAGIRLMAGDGAEDDPPAPLPPLPAGSVTEAGAAAAIARLADSLAAAGRFAGVVRLERGARVVLEKAWGEADREARVPNRPTTRFNLGSINKTFTRAVIAKLVEQGRLGLDDTLSRHLPDFPRDKAGRITIRHLLDMRSGLGDVFTPAYRSADHSTLRQPRDWFPLFAGEPLRFEPGTRAEYSNAGYVVLGAVAEAVTGRSYYDLVREWVYEPAGMKRAGSFAMDEEVSDRAHGYRRDGTRVTRGRPWRGSPAGGGYATAADLAAYVRALRGGRLLGPAMMAELFGVRAPGGFSLGIAGGSPGVNAALIAGSDWTVVVLANLDPPVAEDLARQAARLARAWPGVSDAR